MLFLWFTVFGFLDTTGTRRSLAFSVNSYVTFTLALATMSLLTSLWGTGSITLTLTKVFHLSQFAAGGTLCTFIFHFKRVNIYLICLIAHRVAYNTQECRSVDTCASSLITSTDATTMDAYSQCE